MPLPRTVQCLDLSQRTRNWHDLEAWHVTMQSGPLPTAAHCSGWRRLARQSPRDGFLRIPQAAWVQLAVGQTVVSVNLLRTSIYLSKGLLGCAPREETPGMNPVFGRSSGPVEERCTGRVSCFFVPARVRGNFPKEVPSPGPWMPPCHLSLCKQFLLLDPTSSARWARWPQAAILPLAFLLH